MISTSLTVLRYNLQAVVLSHWAARSYPPPLVNVGYVHHADNNFNATCLHLTSLYSAKIGVVGACHSQPLAR